MRTVVFLAVAAVAAMLPIADAPAATQADKVMGDLIGQQMKESGRLRNYRIGVTFEDGVVWLEGTVTSASQRDTAAGLAKQMKGVIHVINRLEIAEEPANPAGKTTDLAVAFKQSESGSTASRPAKERQASATMTREPIAQNPSGLVRQRTARSNMPVPAGRMQANPIAMQAGGPRPQAASYNAPVADGMGMGMAPPPTAYVPGGSGRAVSYDNAQMPGYAWPSYASYPNYAALTYPQQYSPTAWPYIGPFYPYPQVPLAWRKVALEWDDGWWFLDFSAHNSSH